VSSNLHQICTVGDTIGVQQVSMRCTDKKKVEDDAVIEKCKAEDGCECESKNKKCKVWLKWECVFWLAIALKEIITS